MGGGGGGGVGVGVDVFGGGNSWGCWFRIILWSEHCLGGGGGGGEGFG